MFAQWLLHTVSAFSSEPASCFAATLVLKAIVAFFIDSLFTDFQSFYFTSLFLPLQSIWFAPWVQPALPCPALAASDHAGLSVFSGRNILYRLFFFFFLHQTTQRLHPTPPLTQRVTFTVFSGRHFSAIMVMPFMLQMTLLAAKVLLKAFCPAQRSALRDKRTFFEITYRTNQIIVNKINQ